MKCLLGIIFAVIHPWSFYDCGAGFDDHILTVFIALGCLGGLSILFCSYCHCIATLNCTTGPNYHDSSGIRRRCSGCICLMSMSSLIFGCWFCWFYVMGSDIIYGLVLNCCLMDIEMDGCSVVNNTCYFDLNIYNASGSVNMYQKGEEDNPIWDTWFNCTYDEW